MRNLSLHHWSQELIEDPVRHPEPIDNYFHPSKQWIEGRCLLLWASVLIICKSCLLLIELWLFTVRVPRNRSALVEWHGRFLAAKGLTIM